MLEVSEVLKVDQIIFWLSKKVCAELSKIPNLSMWNKKPLVNTFKKIGVGIVVVWKSIFKLSI